MPSTTEPLDADFIGHTDEAREKLFNYLEKIIRSPDIEGPLTISLRQLGQGDEPEIETFDAIPGDDVKALVEEIVDTAIADGRNSGAKNEARYAVRINGRGGRCAFRLIYPHGDPDATNEAPTDKGTLALTMRHQESLFTTFTEMARDTYRTLREENKAKDARLQHLESMQVGMIKMFSELSDHSFAHKLEVRKIEHTEAQKEQITSFLMQGVPALMNKVLGPGTVTEPATPIEMQLEGFLRSMKPDQFKNAVSTGRLEMDPTQLLGFLEMLDTFQKVRAARAGQPSPPEGGGNEQSSAEVSSAGQAAPINGVPVSP